MQVVSQSERHNVFIIYLGIWKNHWFVFFFIKYMFTLNQHVYLTHGYQESHWFFKCQSTSINKRLLSARGLSVFVYLRKPLYARSGVFSLHYTWKYQKLNVTPRTKHCKAARLHTVHEIFLNARSNYLRSLCILQTDLKYRTKHRCLLGGKGEICV